MRLATESPVTELVERVCAGDQRALARAISLVENDAPEAGEVLSGCFAHTGRALKIGVTGIPGAGKSTLVDRLTRLYRASGRSVGIIAVDPTSPFTGGAILGDRIRMLEQLGDEGLYLRSMATRGSLGGLAHTTADVALLMDASGKQIVLIETVGVGQDEIDVARLADITVVVLVPGMGDDVQSIKAGILEIADIYVINKADREGADRVQKEIRTMQSLVSGQEADAWIPPIVATVATTGEGVEALGAAIEERRQWLAAGDRLRARRVEHWQRRLEGMLSHALLKRTQGQSSDPIAHHASEAAEGKLDPYRLVAQSVNRIFDQKAAGGMAIDHLGIAVRSIDAVRDFYEALGLRIADEETVEHEQVHAAMIPIGSSRIELLEPAEPGSVVGRFIEKHGEGLHHIALRVEDISATLEALKAKGVRLVSDRVQTGVGGHLYFFVHPASASGVLLEICQQQAPHDQQSIQSPQEQE
jgi:LAO/AO transport system kinase